FHDVALRHQLQPVRNVVVYRALPFAVWVAALQAPVCLSGCMGFRERVINFPELFLPLLGRHLFWINPPYFDKLKVIVETFFHSVALISSISTGAARRAQPINLFSRSDYSGRARVLANRLRRFAALGLTSQNRPM